MPDQPLIPRPPKKIDSFRIFDFGALDPLGGPGGPLGPTLEKTVFYDFLKISFFGHNSSLFHSCAILVWTMRFSIFHSIYEHIFTTGFRNFQIRYPKVPPLTPYKPLFNHINRPWDLARSIENEI